MYPKKFGLEISVSFAQNFVLKSSLNIVSTCNRYILTFHLTKMKERHKNVCSGELWHTFSKILPWSHKRPTTLTVWGV